MAVPHQPLASAHARLKEGLLELPLFAKISKRHREAVLEFAQVREFPADTDFIRQGEYTSDFFVILSGIITAYRTEEDGVTKVFEQLGPRSWFGELSALSNQPSLARLKADTACVLGVLDGGLFKELYSFSPGFKEQIDDIYRKRSLVQHLRVVPLLRGLSREILRDLRTSARFESHPKDTVLAVEGEPADAIILVRSGGMSKTRKVPAGTGRWTTSGGLVPDRVAGAGPLKEQLVSYLMANSSIGERAFLGDGELWDGTYTTLMPTEALVIPVAAIRAAAREHPDVLEALTGTARMIALEDSGAELGSGTPGGAPDVALDEQLEIMVHSESIKGGEALAIDLSKCVRCNACVESCVAVHDDGVPRLSKKGNRISASGNSLGKELSLTTSCYHCEAPGCMMSCHYGAIRRDSQGLIRFVWDNCVGCAECVKGCPYDVIRLTAPPDENKPARDSWITNIPLLGALIAGKNPPPAVATDRGYHKEQEVKGKAVKCDRCEGLPFEACVYNCPCGAITRISPSMIFDQDEPDLLPLEGGEPGPPSRSEGVER